MKDLTNTSNGGKTTVWSYKHLVPGEENQIGTRIDAAIIIEPIKEVDRDSDNAEIIARYRKLEKISDALYTARTAVGEQLRENRQLFIDLNKPMVCEMFAHYAHELNLTPDSPFLFNEFTKWFNDQYAKEHPFYSHLLNSVHLGDTQKSLHKLTVHLDQKKYQSDQEKHNAEAMMDLGFKQHELLQAAIDDSLLPKLVQAIENKNPLKVKPKSDYLQQCEMYWEATSEKVKKLQDHIAKKVYS